nr:hypothetical protein [Streptomyces sp. MNU77]
MEQHQQTDPVLTAVLAAIKATVKGGVGKFRERPQGRNYRDGERWPALERPTWRPDIRAAVISKARVNMHRKLSNMVRMTGLYPIAVLSDCVVYPSPGGSPLDFLPYAASGRPQPGGFRLGPAPGMAKPEGVRPMLWAVDLMEQGLNPARHIKAATPSSTKANRTATTGTPRTDTLRPSRTRPPPPPGPPPHQTGTETTPHHTAPNRSEPH